MTLCLFACHRSGESMLAWNDYIQAVVESQPSLMAEQLKKRGMRFKAFVLRVRLLGSTFPYSVPRPAWCYYPTILVLTLQLPRAKASAWPR